MYSCYVEVVFHFVLVLFSVLIYTPTDSLSFLKMFFIIIFNTCTNDEWLVEHIWNMTQLTTNNDDYQRRMKEIQNEGELLDTI